MSERPFRLPPLNALRVFHTVARHRSFRAAADELLVTPQAVSQQIKLLEDTLGIELFERKGRAIEPNESAILLAHFIQAGFDEFAEGIRRVTKAGARNRINLNVSPYFATRYLLARIGAFQETLPGADLRLTTMIDLPDFAGDDVDVAIQWGYGGWKPYEERLILRDVKVLCCVPAMAEGLRAPADLATARLLHPVLSDRLWPDVLRHLGAASPEAQADLRLQDAATLRRATLAGLGVGLISRIDAAEDLRAGKLVAPFGETLMDEMPEEQVPGFFLVLPKGHRRVKPILAFCRWIESVDWLALEQPEA